MPPPLFSTVLSRRRRRRLDDDAKGAKQTQRRTFPKLSVWWMTKIDTRSGR
jgi:hypothetical protein